MIIETHITSLLLTVGIAQATTRADIPEAGPLTPQYAGDRKTVKKQL